MATSTLQIRNITTLGSSTIVIPNNSSGYFGIYIKGPGTSKGTAKYTLYAGLDPAGEIMADPIYINYTKETQDAFSNIGKFIIEVTSLGVGSYIRFEYKTLS